MRVDIRRLLQRGMKLTRLFAGTGNLSRAFCASVLLFAACIGVLIFRFCILPRQADAEMAAARSLYRSPPVSSQRHSGAREDSAPSAAGEEPSFRRLQNINGDVKGWITLPGTAIDYPVLCPPDGSPDYYLTRDWKRSTSRYGSIFMLSAGSASQRKNTVLYGHSMKDGRMFAPLLQFDSLPFYRSHPVLLYRENDGEAFWKIFAVIKANTDPAQGEPFNYQKASFPSSKDFMNYLYQVRIRSILSIPVDLQPGDTILTLSTCSYEFEGFRTAVFARRVRTAESSAVDTARAEENKKVLYPDCWYKQRGGKKPSLPDYQGSGKEKTTP